MDIIEQRRNPVVVASALGLAVVLAATAASACLGVPFREEKTSPRLFQLAKAIEGGGNEKIDSFWSEMSARGTPLVEMIPGDTDHVFVTFLYRGQPPIKAVSLFSQLNPAARESSLNPLSRLNHADVWYKTYRMRNDLRLSYSFVTNPTPASLEYRNPSARSRDPLNPKTLVPGTNIGSSILELPAATPQQYLAAKAGVATGRVEELTVQSKILKQERRAWVYTPADYDPKRTAPYPMLICFDGWVYHAPGFIPTPTILDNLVGEHKITPMLAVLIDQSDQRNFELSNNAQFIDYVTDELLPEVRKKWRATNDPAQTVICGSSTGGLASAFAAFHRPDVFGNVLSQSGAFWPGKGRDDPEQEWITRQFNSTRKLPIRFLLQVGLLEVGATPRNGPSILEMNRHLRDVLVSKGYEVHYDEVAGGHEPLSWAGGLANGLLQLFGQR